MDTPTCHFESLYLSHLPREHRKGASNTKSEDSLTFRQDPQQRVIGYSKLLVSEVRLPALSCVWQHIKLSDVSLETRPRYSLVVEEDVKKPNKQANEQEWGEEIPRSNLF